MAITIHRCRGCKHKHLDHTLREGFCSMGGCRCRKTQDEVRSTGPEETIPTFPAVNVPSWPEVPLGVRVGGEDA